MVTVYVWDFAGKNTAWGHASMRCGNKYISWWPEADRSAKLTDSIPQVYEAHPYVLRSFSDDVSDEGRGPDWEIDINSLDEFKIKSWWAAFNPQAHSFYGPPSSPWSTLEANCSTVVARALTVGGGAAVVPWHVSQSIVWTPNSVRKYARAIADASKPRKHGRWPMRLYPG